MLGRSPRHNVVIAAIVSLLCATWCGSCVSEMTWTAPGGGTALQFGGGAISMLRWRAGHSGPQSRFRAQWRPHHRPMFLMPGKHEYWFTGSAAGTQPGLTCYAMPLWIPTAIAAAILGVLLLRGRTKRGYCATCQYDLTGNVSGRRPECGTPLDERP